jgi:hypothetical protein
MRTFPATVPHAIYVPSGENLQDVIAPLAEKDSEREMTRGTSFGASSRDRTPVSATDC